MSVFTLGWRKADALTYACFPNYPSTFRNDFSKRGDQQFLEESR